MAQQQQQVQYTKRQVWIISEVERVVSYWRLCSPLSRSDIGAALEVLEPFETEVLAMAFKALKQHDTLRSTDKRAPGVRDIQEACYVAKRRLERSRKEAEDMVPVDRQLDVSADEREMQRRDQDELAQEFFKKMRAELGIDKPGADAAPQKKGMTDIADMLPDAPEDKKAAG